MKSKKEKALGKDLSRMGRKTERSIKLLKTDKTLCRDRLQASWGRLSAPSAKVQKKCPQSMKY